MSNKQTGERTGKRTGLTRRDALKAAGATTLALGSSFGPMRAVAQQSTTLRAAIAGFNVINTLDPTTLEFKLRKGVKFQDGSDFTADDVKFTIERVADEKNAAPNRSKVTTIQEIKIADPYTVRIITKAPFAPLINYLTNTRTAT